MQTGKRLTVLMLTWHYSPSQTSGIAKAGHALIQSLKPYHNILEFYPKPPHFHPILQSQAPYHSNLSNAQAFRLELIEALPTLSFDLIHVHDWVGFLAGIELKQQSGKPLIFHIHSLEYDRNPNFHRSPIYHWEKEALQQADAIITVSAYTKGILQSHYAIPPECIQIIYSPLQRIKPYQLSKRHPENLISFIGRFEERKGVRSFLKLARHIQTQSDQFRFVMAGNGSLWTELIEEVLLRPIPRFHFTGQLTQAEVQRLLVISDFLIMPSQSEPFGLIALEAAQLGVPVLLSHQSGVKEILHSALQINHWKVNEMAEAILRSFRYPQIRQSFIRSAFHDLHRFYTSPSLPHLLQLYHSLVSHSN